MNTVHLMTMLSLKILRKTWKKFTLSKNNYAAIKASRNYKGYIAFTSDQAGALSFAN
jgi:hypothetical protein